MEAAKPGLHRAAWLSMTSAWRRVRAVIQRGHQVASGWGQDSPYPRGALAMQTPFFRERGLDLAPYFSGSLNLSILPATFQMVKPEFTFPRVAWTDLHPPETFSFSRCRVVVADQQYAGWVYYPHPETKIRHFQTPGLIEVITVWIAGLAYGSAVELDLNPDEIAVSGALTASPSDARPSGNQDA